MKKYLFGLMQKIFFISQKIPYISTITYKIAFEYFVWRNKH
jgi:hypothetical protein